MPDSPLSRKVLRFLKPRLPQMLAALRRFVNAESPSLEKAAADRCCGVIAEEWNRRGARAERISQKHRGDFLRISHAPGKSRPSGQLLVLLAVFFFAGLQLFFFGVLGEYIGAIHFQVRKRPLVIERERVNFAGQTPEAK